MLLLRLNHRVELDGRHAVEVWLEGDGPSQRATSRFSFLHSAQDSELLRWYLEDYLEFPHDPAPSLALAAEARIKAVGTELFRLVFSGEAGDAWMRVQSRLSQTRVEVTAEPANVSLPWELLRDPRTDSVVALGARSFVRTNHDSARRPRLRAGASGTLRVLLVISRPGGREDVPFRSVASHLIRMGTPTELFGLDVLRPATFAALASALHGAMNAGHPYDVVHFDGHGVWMDLSADERRTVSWSSHRYSTISPIRPGTHGYLAFEDASAPTNKQLIDGPALGNLLAEMDVPVLVLNACRSGHAEALPAPKLPDALSDVHTLVRAYGSLAQEVADAGVPGVVAMRYNVYVVTASRFVANLYAALLAGRELGESVTLGRRALAADPTRTIAYDPVPLQDWMVPIVYEAAPVALFAPSMNESENTLLDRVTVTPEGPGVETLPAVPDVGFVGRDDVLLALDRAFDNQTVVLLWGGAGAGKTASAAEFARWYARTGGTTAIMWSTFDRPLILSSLLDQLADFFAPTLAASGVVWGALSDRSRRAYALELLRNLRLLWVWDNVELIAGFPPGTHSAWSHAEQAELASFLRDLRHTKAKVLLTSRHDEHKWLGQLPARIELPTMHMRERVELASAVAAKYVRRLTDLEDWRPLLRYTEGNPLALTLIASQALRERLRSRADIEAFLVRLRAGEAITDDDETQGRSLSLGASLRYGFDKAFNPEEQGHISLLALFQRFVNVDALSVMCDTTIDHHLDGWEGLNAQYWVGLLNRAAEVGLVGTFGGRYYRLHPVLPWFLREAFATAWGSPGTAEYTRTAWAFSSAMAAYGRSYEQVYMAGEHDVINNLRLDESNLLHAWRLALDNGWPEEVLGTTQGLHTLLEHTGRASEWSGILGEAMPMFTDANGNPRQGREEEWALVMQYRVLEANANLEWTAAEGLLRTSVGIARLLASEDLAKPSGADSRHSLDPSESIRLHNLAVALYQLGQNLRGQLRADCVDQYREAIGVAAQAGDRSIESVASLGLGQAFEDIPEIRNLDEAERWLQRSLELLTEREVMSRARSTGQLGSVARERFMDARDGGASSEELSSYLEEAARRYNDALILFPDDAVKELAVTYGQLALIYDLADDDRALAHYQRAIQYYHESGDRAGAGAVRYNAALMLASERPSEALLYAIAALEDFEYYETRAGHHSENARRLINTLREALADKS